jgi:hypothetical protein
MPGRGEDEQQLLQFNELDGVTRPQIARTDRCLAAPIGGDCIGGFRRAGVSTPLFHGIVVRGAIRRARLCSGTGLGCIEVSRPKICLPMRRYTCGSLSVQMRAL